MAMRHITPIDQDETAKKAREMVGTSSERVTYEDGGCRIVAKRDGIFIVLSITALTPQET